MNTSISSTARNLSLSTAILQDVDDIVKSASVSDVGLNLQPCDMGIERLTYTSNQVCAALQISPVTLWRLEKRGLLVPIRNLRHKRFSVAAVRRFAANPSSAQS